MMQTQRRQRDPLGLPPDLTYLSPYAAYEQAQLGYARAQLSRDRSLIDAWAVARDAAYTQCVLTGVVTE